MKPVLLWLRWHLCRGWQILGWSGCSGLFLLGVVLVFYARILGPAAADLVELNAASATLAGRLADNLGGEAASAPLDQFYDLFPESTANAMNDALTRIVMAAAIERLSLEQGEYCLREEPWGDLVRYDLVLGVRGDEAQGLRRFLANSMRTMPNLALTGIRFNPQASGHGGLAAELRFSLYLRGGTAPIRFGS